MIRQVAIVGAGFSGTLLAINLLRHDGPAVTLIERSPSPGLGVAYDSAHADHLLNVRAANMSAFPDQPDHFTAWLLRRGDPRLADTFVPRAIYGQYLRELLDAAQALAPARLHVVTADAVALDGRCVMFGDGGAVEADAVVLAIGNLPPHVPPGFEAVADHPAFVRNPWAEGNPTALRDDDTVLLLGSGLTMVDVAIRLDASGFRGRMVALSRRGLLPHRHAPVTPASDRLTERPRTPLSTLLRMVRTRGNHHGWRGAVNELRPFTQGIWAAASSDERRRFLRHLRPWWDIHRHRLAPAVADRIATLIDSGRLAVVAGKPVDVSADADGITIRWRPRGSEHFATMPATRVISCIGPQGDLTRTDDPLLARLVADGAIRPDQERLGIDVDHIGRVRRPDGSSDDRLFAVGPMTRGAFWEIVAVPDIRRQTWDVARYLSNAHWVAGEGL